MTKALTRWKKFICDNERDIFHVITPLMLVSLVIPASTTGAAFFLISWCAARAVAHV